MSLSDDQRWMRRALQLARKGHGRTSPNPLVGAVLVKKGRIVAEGWHRRFGGEHAEAAALRKAGEKARGADLYVTLEPCAHFGKTPPCVDRVLDAGVRRVVIGTRDPNPSTRGRSICRLRQKGVHVETGILAEECRRLNPFFFFAFRHQRPFIFAKTAQTLDGRIALGDGTSQWITALPVRWEMRKLRNEVDAILVGTQTVLLDNPRLEAPDRRHKLKKIVLDRRLVISSKARLFEGAAGRCFVVTTVDSSAARRKRLEARGVTCWVSPVADPVKMWVWLVRKLHENEVRSLLIEGGGRTLGSALAAGRVDEWHLALAPSVCGDASARPSVSGMTIKRLGEMIRLDFDDVRVMHKHILVRARVIYPHSR